MATFAATLDAGAQYLALCTIYGAGFYFLPGTEICLNQEMRDARVQTTGGAWRWWEPPDYSEPVGSLRGQCGGGLVKFGDIDNSGLLVNERQQFETSTRMLLSLKDNEYISEVIFRGGFTGVGRGSFCMFYQTDQPGVPRAYQPIACIDTAPHAAGTVPVSFTPRTPRAPASLAPTYVVGANGYPWDVATAAEVGGRLEVWLCIKKGIRS